MSVGRVLDADNLVSLRVLANTIYPKHLSGVEDAHPAVWVVFDGVDVFGADHGKSHLFGEVVFRDSSTKVGRGGWRIPSQDFNFWRSQKWQARSSVHHQLGENQNKNNKYRPHQPLYFPTHFEYIP